MPRKPKRAKPGPKPSGATEVQLLLEMPALLRAAVDERAAAGGLSRAEWIRRAIRAELGWDRVPGAAQLTADAKAATR